ncbi:hypothetical protein C0V77_01990 [Emticicia sp. TH156]|nr:hypothetical protein C0V77_01990 [Emticicia sp. TH156]
MVSQQGVDKYYKSLKFRAFYKYSKTYKIKKPCSKCLCTEKKDCLHNRFYYFSPAPIKVSTSLRTQ